MYNTEAALKFRKHSFWRSSRVLALSGCEGECLIFGENSLQIVQQLRAPAAVGLMIGLRASPMYNEFHGASTFAAIVPKFTHKQP